MQTEFKITNSINKSESVNAVNQLQSLGLEIEDTARQIKAQMQSKKENQTPYFNAHNRN